MVRDEKGLEGEREGPMIWHSLQETRDAGPRGLEVWHGQDPARNNMYGSYYHRWEGLNMEQTDSVQMTGGRRRYILRHSSGGEEAEADVL